MNAVFGQTIVTARDQNDDKETRGAITIVISYQLAQIAMLLCSSELVKNSDHLSMRHSLARQWLTIVDIAFTKIVCY